MIKVFVSSTCYDLIDMRVEVEQHLLRLGLTPVMSDRPSLEFKVIPDANSIETCLTNVRSCDIFLIILSQRYGPSLKEAGYPDISATHLEYLEAKKLKKPIYMYVRDRLDSDFTIWKRNKDKKVQLSWVNEGAEKIFDLLSEHGKLAASGKNSNWFWIFRDSCELKERISQDLEKESGKAILSKLIESGKIAHLIPELKNWSIDKNNKQIEFTVSIINAGATAAISGFAIFEKQKGDEKIIDETQMLPLLLPGQGTDKVFSFMMPDEFMKAGKIKIDAEFMYATAEGHQVSDEFELELEWNLQDNETFGIFNYQAKRYYHSSAFKIKVKDEE